jgi:hypothetical protein
MTAYQRDCVFDDLIDFHRLLFLFARPVQVDEVSNSIEYNENGAFNQV